MYSRNKGITGRDIYLTPPPGYDGSRFRRRSDGRDDAYPLYGDGEKSVHAPHRPMQSSEPRTKHSRRPPPKKEHCTEEFMSDAPFNDGSDKEPEEGCDCPFEDRSDPPDLKEESRSSSFVSEFLKSLGSEELLLIALIILLAKDSNAGSDTVLLLALLLCIS